MKKVKGRRTKETKEEKNWISECMAMSCRCVDPHWDEFCFLLRLDIFHFQFPPPTQFFVFLSFLFVPNLFTDSSTASLFPAGQTCHISTLVHTFLLGFSVGWCIVTVAKFRPGFCVSCVFSLARIDILSTCILKPCYKYYILKQTNKSIIWFLVLDLDHTFCYCSSGFNGETFVSVCHPHCACWDMPQLHTTLKKNQYVYKINNLIKIIINTLRKWSVGQAGGWTWFKDCPECCSRINKEPDRTNKRGGDVPGQPSYGTSVIPLLASWHEHTHTTNKHRPDSLLGQMASWWGAVRSITKGLGWFVNHDLHTSLLLTLDKACMHKGWTGIRSVCVCVCVGWGWSIYCRL